MSRQIDAIRCAWDKTPMKERKQFKEDAMIVLASGVIVPLSVAGMALASTERAYDVALGGLASGLSVGAYGAYMGKSAFNKIRKRYEKCLKEVV
jgi:hypothetical protein